MSNLGNKEAMSDNLHRLLHDRGISQRKVANDLNISPTTFSSWVNGIFYPRIDKIEKLADYFNVKKSALIEPNGDDSEIKVFKDITQVPVIGNIACGDPITAIQNVEEYMPAPSSSLPVGNNFYLRCDGDSMKPTINSGSLVLIHEQPTVEDGEIAAVLIDGDATLKRVKHQGKTVILMPDNNQYNPIVITDDIDARILGKAVQVVNSL
ncbi:LexA repressor [Apilactobacillus kunkeei]|nr:LexA repressor [Apilactobacillus kunkeei]